jgi:hypothetical protein
MVPETPPKSVNHVELGLGSDHPYSSAHSGLGRASLCCPGRAGALGWRCVDFDLGRSARVWLEPRIAVAEDLVTFKSNIRSQRKTQGYGQHRGKSNARETTQDV